MVIDDPEKFPSFSGKALLLGMVFAVVAHGVLVFYWIGYESIEHENKDGSMLTVNIELEYDRIELITKPKVEVASSVTVEPLNKEKFSRGNTSKERPDKEKPSKEHPPNKSVEPDEQKPKFVQHSSSEKHLVNPSLNTPLESLPPENKKETVFRLESDTQLWVRDFAPEWNSGESSADDIGDGRIFDPRLRAAMAAGRGHGRESGSSSLTTYKNAYGNDIIRSPNGKRCFKLMPSDTPNVPDQVSLPFDCDGELSESEKMAEALRKFSD